ncbi:regulatory protein RecX [Thiomicrorhabdus sp. HH1]|uniref:Regulatory protein RecX n=1 Tax=Thiomicrorhabdus heinhorstiae TaxID=2748010 RepID=A0ABS0BTD3_9GAMM|nr:regulatory protein RecX [Thiomicrorhabdus heinhorstiae]
MSTKTVDNRKPSEDEFRHRIEARAVALLAQREHGLKELRQKLRTKFPWSVELQEENGLDQSALYGVIDEVLQLCVERRWQSDERYIEQAVNSLSGKGQGPLKIRQKLQQTCSDESLIDAYLDWDEADWVELARQSLDKKYGSVQRPKEIREQAKRMRFLQGRGFYSSTIRKAFR